MPLINCKVSLKLRWKKHCALAAASVHKANVDDNMFFFYYQRHKIICLLSHFIAKFNQELSKVFSKGFERSVYWNEYKTKSANKNTTKEYRYFSNQTL